MKKHNFYAGPSILSEYTIKHTADAVNNFAETGLSLLEVSHRSKEFVAVMDEAQALVKELLDVPEGYHVLYLGGGASLQFCMAPMNLLRTKAGYLDTGTWAANAIKEARLFGDVEVLASSKEANYNFYPRGYEVPADLDYFHITTNNTIYGTELREDPTVSVPSWPTCRAISSRVLSMYRSMTLSMPARRKILVPPVRLSLSSRRTLSVRLTA